MGIARKGHRGTSGVRGSPRPSSRAQVPHQCWCKFGISVEGTAELR